MKNIIFISKDALNRHALPTYGNQYWETPNIDALARKGTVFMRHYTAAASTAMAFTSMAIGDYCYKTNRKDYKGETPINGDTLFDKIYDAGYECHIAWDSTYTKFAETHFRCEGLHTQIHSMPHVKQYVSSHKKGEFDDITPDNEETEIALKIIRDELVSIKENATKNIFLWMHLPHVMRGRQGYGSDVDVFDKVIGIARELFGDDDIFVSADHGHMNGWKNKYHYGFDVGEETICIPLITPKINHAETIDFPTSTIQMLDILLKREISPLEYVICETAYYVQPKRKVAIIRGNYKYVYSKDTKKEELYDLAFDKEENHNLVYPEFYDTDRCWWYSTAQCFYYPYWDTAQKTLAELRQIKDSFWRVGGWGVELYNRVRHRAKFIYTRIKYSKPQKNIQNIGK